MMVDPYWYPALNVAAHFNADFAEIPAPKKAKEMMAVAIAMAGMQAMHSHPYWIQGVSDTEGSPDVRTMCNEKRDDGQSPWGLQQDVEVVTYTQHSATQTLAEFVAGTKLAVESPYDALTTILVDVQAATKLPLPDEWAAVLAATGRKNPVLVLGKIHPTQPIYRLAVVHPVVEGAIDYNPFDLLRGQGYTKVLKIKRGLKVEEIYDPNEKHCPFEKFGVRCKLLSFS